jgi:hypothetical protein
MRSTIAVVVAAFLSVTAWQAYWWETPSGGCLPWQNINTHPCQTMEPCPPEFGEGEMCWHGKLTPPLTDKTEEQMAEWRKWERLQPKLSALYAGTIDIPTCDGKTDMTSVLQAALTRVENINNARRQGWHDYERCVVPHALRMHGGICLLSAPIKIYGWVHFEGGGAVLVATGNGAAIEVKMQDEQP